MTFHRQQETFRISSRGKGSSSKGGGGRTLSRRKIDSKIIAKTNLISSVVGESLSTPSLLSSQLSLRLTGSSGASSSVGVRWCADKITVNKRYGPAACMIIENYPPLPTRSRHNTNQDTTQRLLNHLVLPKHRSSKFSSNRHRKLYQPFRET
ncbi:uncharacterized protein LOC130669263 isoform X1 [Microplitis mediator]|uniref:uncharacterized protein LOC130669263 isoform X1 n=1 Tax=Microplitis mediator TaxID=375433 RepID=UPI002555B1F6|nr:uncharacterized protein LOC130669263 isoform X1 [Microplitis mediator]